MVIHGLKTSDWAPSEYEERVKNFFNETLCIPVAPLMVELLRSKKDDKPILATLSSQKDKIDIYKNCHKLKQLTQKIIIEDELTRDERRKKQELIPLLKEEKRNGNQAYFRGPHLIVNGKQVNGTTMSNTKPGERDNTQKRPEAKPTFPRKDVCKQVIIQPVKETCTPNPFPHSTEKQSASRTLCMQEMTTDNKVNGIFKLQHRLLRLFRRT